MVKNFRRRTSEDAALDYRYLLLSRFALINLTAVALLGAAYGQGWFDAIHDIDTLRLVIVIALVFLYGLGLCGWRIWRTSIELNHAHGPSPAPGSRAARYLDAVRNAPADSRQILAQSLRLDKASRIAGIRHVANALVFLGLIGTVIGFIVALSGVRPETASDANQIGPTIATLIGGMSIALYTTLVGAILHIWLIVNHRLLERGTVQLINTVIERGETDGRA